MPEEITNIPVADRTFEGFAKIGYTMESAVADLLDNSIAQGEADNIHIIFDLDSSGLTLRIYDDGLGMCDEKLFEAMTIGSSSAAYREDDLSMYGIGMKAASMSQCKTLTVISKALDSEYTGYRWDIKTIKERGWKVLRYDSGEAKTIKDYETVRIKQLIGNPEELENESWTLICWDNLEKINDDFFSLKTEQAKDKYISKKIDKLKLYLSTVFHRFLVGENGVKNISIYLNGEKLKSFDPFCRDEPNTIEDPFIKDEGDYIFPDSDVPPITIKRYILPTKEGNLGFSSLNNWSKASGYLNWNDAQGYYFYRNNRLIDFGGWFGVKGKDEHDKLARVSIDLSSKHDGVFSLDLKKTNIQQIRDSFKLHLREKVNKNYIQRAKDRYKKAEKKRPDIKNKIRNQKNKVNDLSNQLVKTNEIVITESTSAEGTTLNVQNPNGEYSEKDLFYRELDPNHTIITTDFGNDGNFWKMVPGPGNYFQILLNESHPFYEKIYLKAANNKAATSSVDALLYTLAFIELRLKTNENKTLFMEINEVASDTLKSIIEKNLL